MNNDSEDARILAQEQGSIESLAREAQADVAAVRKVFLVEYKRLAAHAHITAYLPLLTSHRVREILEAANKGTEKVP